MRKIKIKLSDGDYKIIKKIDFSEIQDEVFFNNETNEFQTASPLAEVIFEEYINAHAFDSLYNVTEYGKKLYELYDLIFFSEEI